jgi:DNA integrity scanning protein DisA with diadenylate cyclase activity
MNPEITVMEIDKSKFYLIGIRYDLNISQEVISAVTEQIDEYLKEKGVDAAIIPLGLEAQNIVELDESLSKDLLEIIQNYKNKKNETTEEKK